MPIVRTATCRCGQLSLACTGVPVRVSVCHCHNCQKRSGSAFAVQARFAIDHVAITGDHRQWAGAGDSGGVAVFHFCPVCGSTVFYRAGYEPDMIAVAVGAFADNMFPPPQRVVYEGRQHGWLAIIGDDIERFE